jgi:hypothetical protein
MYSRNMFSILLFGVVISSCGSAQEKAQCTVNYITTFYGENGKVAFTGKTKLWQNGNLFIQQVYTIKINTDEYNKKTVEYEPRFCRLTDLGARCFYDFHMLSDTSSCFSSGNLPEFPVSEGAWPFYSDKIEQIDGTPEMLKDTIIKGKNYKKIKYCLKSFDCTKNYFVGLFPDGMAYSELSFEKKFSKEKNWLLSKRFHYNIGSQYPSVLQEIEFLSDKLSAPEERIFDAWEKYAREHPVKNK